MFQIQNVLLPTDFSKISYSAFGYARALAEQYNATIHLIYVQEKTAPFLAIRSVDVSEDKIEDSLEEDAEMNLKEAVSIIKDSSTINIIPVLRKGTDYEEVIAYSREIKADLIVICTHGRTGLLHTLMGSVAEKIIRHSKIPVLVIPPPEQDS